MTAKSDRIHPVYRMLNGTAFKIVGDVILWQQTLASVRGRRNACHLTSADYHLSNWVHPAVQKSSWFVTAPS